MKYRVKEFKPGLFHVIDSDAHPIYDGARDGRDKPLVFRDVDDAYKCIYGLNNGQGISPADMKWIDESRKEFKRTHPVQCE